MCVSLQQQVSSCTPAALRMCTSPMRVDGDTSPALSTSNVQPAAQGTELPQHRCRMCTAGGCHSGVTQRFDEVPHAETAASSAESGCSDPFAVLGLFYNIKEPLAPHSCIPELFQTRHLPACNAFVCNGHGDARTGIRGL